MITPRSERLAGWGMANFGTSLSYRPRDAAEAAEAIADAARRGLTVAHRGAGISYGDAALNDGGAVVHLSALDRILSFDPGTGVVRAEAGVTIAQLWKHVIPSGWWPPVVPGTMHVTIGGSAAMNIHGKNGYRVGPFGEHVLALTLLDARGTEHTFTRECHRQQIRTILGAQGLNGTILDVTLQLKRVYSGLLNVTPIPTRSLDENLETLDRLAVEHDYAVGWMDAFATGPAMGRGLLHTAEHLPPDHAAAGTQMTAEAQQLPASIFGVLPSRHAWRLARPLVNAPGMRAVNLAKYIAGQLGGTKPFLQGHAAFHFLLDYIPNWKYVYRPHGLVQYQFFAPKEMAHAMFREALLLQQRSGLRSFLAVLKRHRKDDFDASYSVDGYSLALDLPVHGQNPTRLLALLRDFDRLQAEMGGHVYAAKDSVSRGALPKVRDPLYSSDLVRRWESPS